MKKTLFSIALIFCGLTLFAQNEGMGILTPKESDYGTKEFNPYWFGQLEVGAAYTVGEAKFAWLLSPAGSIAIGRQFTEVIGARFSVSGWESKGGRKNLDMDYKFNYIAGNIDILFNMTNLLCGYVERPFDLYLFVGGGVNYAFNNDEAKRYSKRHPLKYLWKDDKLSPVCRAGILMGYGITDRTDITLEGNFNCLTDKYNSKKGSQPDFYINALLGISYAFGPKSKTQERTTPIIPVVVPEDKEEKSVVVEKKVTEKPAPVVKEIEPCKVNVFFGLNKAIVTEEEKAKIEQLANFMKQHKDSKATITGYADLKTGNPTYNKTLSKRRAEAVKQCLVDTYSIEENRISVESKGDIEQPFTENDKNRVCICIANN